ncbi:hypothetical protein [Streptomyces canus]|uniref:hypothetical protein n=1 Tax=Streptomyces canus TaxID=58343 RepID=UPI000747AB47|nr:hypothetical protein [Streptomyces canus]KUN14584.1 hypothetical protein AQI96_03805 [Streptomyces canus]
MTQVLVVGVGAFDGDGSDDDSDPLAPGSTLAALPSVAPAITRLAAQLAKTPGLRVWGGEASYHPDHDTLMRLWREALLQRQVSAGAEALIVHFAGHGIAGSGNQSLFLATRETTRRNLSTWTAAPVESLLLDAETVADAPPVLLLLDVCGAGRAVVQQLMDGIRTADRRAWVIAACAPDERTYRARFTSAIGAVLERLCEGQLDISPALKHVPVETLAREIDRELARSAAAEELPSQSVLRTAHPEARVPVPSFLPNPSYRATAGGQFRQAVEMGLWQFAAAVDPALDPLHFISRASGAPQQQGIAQGCFFTGRKEQLKVIKRWLEGPSEPSLMVVTGSPGSGKSALLGVVACLAHPQLREVTRQIAGAVDREVRPEANPDLVAVHARQRGPAEVLASIAAQLGLDEDPGRGWTATAVLDRIAEQRSRPVTVVVDALDEASLDMALVEVLQQLADGRRRPDAANSNEERVLCRVLVGTRPWWDRYAGLLEDLADEEQLDELDDAKPWEAKYATLLKELADAGRIVDLDRVSVAQRITDLTHYLGDVLETSRAYSGLDAAVLRKDTARAVAEQLGRRHKSGAFLLASLFAHYLVHQNAAPSVEEVIERVPADLPAMLDLHLDVLQQEQPMMSAVLAAVAHGYGQGMPLEVIHSVARTFVPPDDSAPDLDDVRKALSVASFYLRFSTDSDGQRLYRFYHQSLVDHLRSVHARVSRSDIFTCVLDTVPGPASVTSRRFSLALPYVLRHAAQHAVDAGALDELLVSASFLVFCDPLLLHEHRSSRTVRGKIAVLMSRAALSAAHEPWQRREWLRDTAVVWGETWLVEALDALEEPTAQRPGYAALNFAWGTAELPTESAGSPPEHGFTAVLVRCADRWLAVGDTYEGQLEVWDVRMGIHLFSLDVPDDSPLGVLSGGYGTFGALVAAGTDDGRVVVWDLDTGEMKIAVQTDAVPVIALGIVEQAGRPLVVACGGGEITAYDLAGNRVASLDVLAEWLVGLEAAEGGVADLYEPDLDIEGYDCTAVGAAVLDGTEVYVAGAVDGALHVWEAEGRSHAVWPGGQEAVTHLQILPGPGGPFIVTGAGDGTRVWNVRTGASRLLDGVGEACSGTVLITEDGRPCFAYFERGSGICARALDDGTSVPVARPRLPKELAGVRALAADGTQLAAVGWVHDQAKTSAWEKTVLLAQSAQAGEPSLLESVMHPSALEHVAVGKAVCHGWLLAASVSEDGTLCTWDALTGRKLLSGRVPNLTAVATGCLEGKEVLVLGRGFGRNSVIEIRDIATGEPACAPVAWHNTVHKLSVEDVDGATKVVVHTLVDISVLALGEDEPRKALSEEERQGRPAECFALGWHRDESIVVVASEAIRRAGPAGPASSSLTVQSASGGSRVLVEDHASEITNMAIGRWDGYEVVVTGDDLGFVGVLCLETGRELASFQAHGEAITSVAFAKTAETMLLVTSGEDNRISVWDPRGPGVLAGETAFPDSLGAVTVSDLGVFAGFGSRVAFFTWGALPGCRT